MTTAVTEAEQYDETAEGPSGGEPRTSASVRAMGAFFANRTKWLLARLSELIGRHKPISAVSASSDTLTVTGHGLSANAPARVQSIGGSVPAGLAEGTVYFAIIVDANTIKLAATSGGGAINLTDAGSGTLYLFPVVDSFAALYAPAVASLPAGSLRSILAAMPTLAGTSHWTGPQTFDDITLSSTNRVKLESRSVSRVQEFLGVPDPTDGWNLKIVSPGGVWTQTAAGGWYLTIPLHVPDGATITSVTVYVTPFGGHGALPTQPTVNLWRTNVVTGVKTDLGTASDAQGSVVAYEAHHGFQLSALSEVVNRATSRYAVRILGESGGAFIAGLTVTGVTVTYTTTSLED